MAMTSITVDSRTAEAVDALKAWCRLDSMAEVFRRSVALLRIMIRYADEDGAITVIQANGEPIRLLLRV